MTLLLALLLALMGCTYNTTDESALASLSQRLATIEQRQDTIESRVNAQGEVLLRHTR